MFSIFDKIKGLQTTTIMTTDKIPQLPVDRHFLFLYDSCLYMVHSCLGPFFGKLQKQWGHRFTYFNFFPPMELSINEITQKMVLFCLLTVQPTDVRPQDSRPQNSKK